MRLGVVFRQDLRGGAPVTCYAASYVDAFRGLGHEVVLAGEGHERATADMLPEVDAIVEIENGRSESGKLYFHGPYIERTTPKAVVLIDSHGHPDHHQAVSRAYDHVFFAVWARRDLFAQHVSAHWCPNATDSKWFGYGVFEVPESMVDFGFFGSRRGLTRADEMTRICQKNGWSYDVREVTKPRRNRWPQTGAAMTACRNLFNHGQKHDGPNQRVMESLCVGRPLLNDIDERDGMSKLFEHGVHYLAYTPGTLEEQMRWLMDHPEEAKRMAMRGCGEVHAKHLVFHRARQILEVLTQ